jgi:hypothetical protein
LLRLSLRTRVDGGAKGEEAPSMTAGVLVAVKNVSTCPVQYHT